MIMAKIAWGSIWNGVDKNGIGGFLAVKTVQVERQGMGGK